MEYSEQVLGSCSPLFSNDGCLVTHGAGSLAVVRDAASLDVLSEFDCNGAVAQARLSPDGQYLLCVMKKGAVAHVFDLAPDSDRSFTLSEGAAGLVHACWAPSNHVLTITDHALRTTCWTLAEGAAASKLAVTLKHPDGRSVAFLGGLALLLERRAGEDAVSVWHASTWVLASRWRTGVHSAEEVVCTASGEVLLWDVDAVCLHSVDGTLLAHFHGEALRACVASPQPGGMIACLTHDFALLVLAANTLECVAVLPTTSTLRGPPSAVVYREERAEAAASQGQEHIGLPRFAVPSFPVSLVKPAGGSSVSSASIQVHYASGMRNSCITWNRDSNVVATRSDMMPHCVWLWDIERLLLLSVLHLRSAVRTVSWEAAGGDARLAVAAGGRHVYLWTHGGASTVAVPHEEFKAGALTWSATGSLLVQNNSCDAWTIASPIG